MGKRGPAEAQMSDFHTLVEKTKSKIRSLMEDKEGRPGYMSDQQLEAIGIELDKMDRIRDKRVFCPYYPKVIIDGWDYKDPFAKQLMDILDVYDRL